MAQPIREKTLQDRLADELEYFLGITAFRVDIHPDRWEEVSERIREGWRLVEDARHATTGCD